jgi:Ca2+-binding RTX toxin-like protein
MSDLSAIDLTKLSGDLKYAIDYLGDENDNALTGASDDEIFIAGMGDDTLTGNGGMDVFNAGAGNDTIIINASNPLLPNTLRILVLVEASNTSFRLSIRVLLPEPVMSIFSIS